jgi:S1-C subfamily serine protease
MKGLASHVVTALVTLAVVMFWVGGRGFPAGRGKAPDGAGTPSREMPPPPSLEPLPPEVLERSQADERVNIHVYQSSNRGVVNINAAGSGSGLFGAELSSNSGSGFIIDKQGRILTNYHVVADAEELQVTLFDGSTHAARLVGIDPNNDVAIVQIDVPPEALVPLPLGDSSGLLVGQKVLALGNPFGLERTLTTGIVSSLDRSIRAKNGRSIKGIIQTDAAINPGNSGGPLLNARGEVVGVTTAILSQVGQSAGIGFAVPINTIKRVLRPLIERGHVSRADLGIREVFSTDRGLYIIDQEEGGPSDRAGLRPIQVVIERLGRFYRTRPDPDSADLIVAVDGRPVRSVDELLTEVEKHEPGEDAVLTVIRGGRTRDVQVRLGATD